MDISDAPRGMSDECKREQLDKSLNTKRMLAKIQQH